MEGKSDVQISQIFRATGNHAVIKEVERIFSYYYSKRAFADIKRTYNLIEKLFDGKFNGYRKCNTEYHNFSHTLDALLASARLIDGYNISNQKFSESLAINILLAALFHDTGYIQESWDDQGTGAKYTKSHVERSVAFVKKNSTIFDIHPDDLRLIVKIINCTGVQVNWDEMSFENLEEEIAGAILGTADLLGQMSDRAYLEKLLFLYYEFKEAGIEGFDTEFDIIKNTLGFFSVTKQKFTTALLGVYVYARDHFETRYGIDRNLYMDAIERQMEYLQKIIDDDTSNFRHKLKRNMEIKKGRSKRPSMDYFVN